MFRTIRTPFVCCSLALALASLGLPAEDGSARAQLRARSQGDRPGSSVRAASRAPIGAAYAEVVALVKNEGLIVGSRTQEFSISTIEVTDEVLRDRDSELAEIVDERVSFHVQHDHFGSQTLGEAMVKNRFELTSNNCHAVRKELVGWVKDATASRTLDTLLDTPKLFSFCARWRVLGEQRGSELLLLESDQLDRLLIVEAFGSSSSSAVGREGRVGEGVNIDVPVGATRR